MKQHKKSKKSKNLKRRLLRTKSRAMHLKQFLRLRISLESETNDGRIGGVLVVHRFLMLGAGVKGWWGWGSVDITCAYCGNSTTAGTTCINCGRLNCSALTLKSDDS